MKIPFISGEAPDGSLPINLYFSPQEIYGRDALIGRPGLVEFADTGISKPITAMHTFNGGLFALCGRGLFFIDSLGNATLRGEIEDEPEVAWIEDNGNHVSVVAGLKAYVYDNGKLTKLTESGMSFKPGSLAYEGGYFIAHAENTKNFYESELNDGTDYNQLDYAIVTTKPDNIVCVVVSYSEVYAIGSISSEVYYNSGASSFSFSKVPGGNIPCGTVSPKSPVEVLGTIIMLNNNRVIVTASTQPMKLSDRHIDENISKMVTVSDALSFSFTERGHTFLVETFPSEDKTFVLDMTTKFWYDWQTNGGRWRPNCYARCYDKHLAGDYKNGKIYEISSTTYKDGDDYILRQRSMPLPITNGPVNVPSFRLEMEAGVGIESGQGSDPKVMLTYSSDKGKTWSNEIWRDIGKAGKYKHQAIWNRLGSHYEFTPKITITDPVKVVITGAHIGE